MTKSLEALIADVNAAIARDSSIGPNMARQLIAALEQAQQQNKLHERAEFTFMNALGLLDTADRNEILPGILATNYALSAANRRVSELESLCVNPDSTR